MRFARVVTLCLGVAACGGGEQPLTATSPTEPAPGADAGGQDASAGPGTNDAGAAETGSPSCAGKGGAPGRFERTLTSRGSERSYVLHVPRSYDPSRRFPLVLAFHGFTRDPADIAAISHLDVVAEEKGFLVAFPASVSGSWNAGACCGTARFNGVDDVGFASDLVDALSAEHCIDDKRVFATGFSNGGFLSHRLACELGAKIAAIASVSGVIGVTTCAPARAVPVLQVHGGADPVVPYAGNALLGYASVESTVSGWAARNGCGASAAEISREGSAHCDRYPSCRDGADVELCTVDGYGHDWPGGGTLWTDAGPPAGFVATTRIVDFFEKHPMR